MRKQYLKYIEEQKESGKLERQLSFLRSAQVPMDT